jgi:hypothetical protein
MDELTKPTKKRFVLISADEIFRGFESLEMDEVLLKYFP